MKPTMKRLMAACCALPLLWAAPAQAGDAINVKITQISPDRDGKALVFIDTARTVKPACALSSVTYSLPTNTDGGRAILSTLITALAADLPVDIIGASVCTEYSNTESLGYVSVRRRAP
ncbi:hypothetical protein [Caulobacter sp. Root1472]|uniref:hypothetical protein n=1 Tax=Caulobacter sp. Root1472 TaxID=1736470 RepID=UPI0006FBD115|nr:hypothetical protein [Caulobacter sp. Root1472]KQZ22903.1 hypothetical protein ASD47_24305 [Caulobacter sp. Root1472]